ncbi:LOW QUALITY PROTEIN: zinc fingers and homeoboxes protein 2 [Tachyglossus aculeatus]|uniref:LOW QUALITY PROTEIN: zinc fingers and homeoboxes protein 2 n=1 Tax=Tachyglossus aculeatus TaxID=9261 RepID=UPI0018F40F68|nr:LOW QUALITY PROTEIN: zinc fingers and homeoboxes protein 2 [Tachyglossus aculeatus]
MASKRKSTTPCMLRAAPPGVKREATDVPMAEPGGVGGGGGGDTPEAKSRSEPQPKKLQGGYECKYCPYSTQNLNEFTEHVDLHHPNVILNPLYVCAECDFTTKKYDSLSDHNARHHPGETNFKLKLLKRNNQTVLEQSIEAPAGRPDPETPGLGKTRGARRAEEEPAGGAPCLNGAEPPRVPAGHVTPSVQPPPNVHLVPKVPVPLNSAKYDSALDTNATMIGSFNRFPYPTQAELSWLTAASRHPEEHIRVWFATQRLKHGISWSPEEVEEARKKMFNGTIPPAPPTLAVLPTQMPRPGPRTAVPCQILGPAGLVLAQVADAPAVPCSPVALAVAGGLAPGQKRPPLDLRPTLESKRVQAAAPTPPAPPGDRKKTKEQIAALKASFLASQFPAEAEVYRLIGATGLSRSEIKKWFSDHRYRSQRGIVHITSESLAKDRLAIAATRPPRGRRPGPDAVLRCFGEKTPVRGEPGRLGAEADPWFSDRRQLGEGRERVLAESGVPNGAPQPGSTVPCPAPYESREQVRLLQATFSRTQWPTPQEYDRLAAQTGLVRTEIVRWFKENRGLLRTGTLKWVVQPRDGAEDRGHEPFPHWRGFGPPADSPRNGRREVRPRPRGDVEEEEDRPTVVGAKAGGGGRDGHCSDGHQEAGGVDWVEVTVGEGDAVSDGPGGLAHTDPEILPGEACRA